MLLGMDLEDLFRRAAAAVASADALVITAGAGMGVDSGLPDFRGTQGFWRAYPVYEKLGLDFAAMANPRWFKTEPELAWGFYGHRLGLYRKTKPHAGFLIMRKWAQSKKQDGFVFTSNVDGQFQRAGYADDRVVEAHGSIHHMQCVNECGVGIIAADPYAVEVDEKTFRATPPLPACPRCGGLLRPNILMFGDFAWESARTEAQEARLGAFLRDVGKGRVTVIECGAGTAIPTVRHFSEQASARQGGTLIRINVREPKVPGGHIGIPLGALEALTQMDACMGA